MSKEKERWKDLLFLKRNNFSTFLYYQTVFIVSFYVLCKRKSFHDAFMFFNDLIRQCGYVFSIITLPDWIKAVFHTQNILFPPSMFCKNVEKYFYNSLYLPDCKHDSHDSPPQKKIYGLKFLALDSRMWMCCVVCVFRCQMWAATEHNFIAMRACVTTVCVNNCLWPSQGKLSQANGCFLFCS